MPFIVLNPDELTGENYSHIFQIEKDTWKLENVPKTTWLTCGRTLRLYTNQGLSLAKLLLSTV